MTEYAWVAAFFVGFWLGANNPDLMNGGKKCWPIGKEEQGPNGRPSQPLKEARD